MNTYTIYIGNKVVATISGSEATYACYEAAKTIGEMTNQVVDLVWDETGEIIATTAEEEEEE